MTTIASMTGFARAEGATEGIGWAWELPSVNGRTLELRFRQPNGSDSREDGWREIVGKSLRRGNVSAFIAALVDFVASRQAAGDRLAAVLNRQSDEIATLCTTVATQVAGQPAGQQARMLDNLQQPLRDTPSLSGERIAQEVALLASRSDVREELDRLSSHVTAAGDLMRDALNIGRRLDFLIQVFNREANTLCDESASPALPATGLKLKAAIEQGREQVQNIE